MKLFRRDMTVAEAMSIPTVWSEMRRRGFSLFRSVDGNWYVMRHGQFYSHPERCATVDEAYTRFRVFAERYLEQEQKATE